ncbi:MAG TPA: VOC family protein [Thermoanaerobaculia bacterium]|jgi:catechol 2,3-dioxygenase-like lactoylglutathione lyase family enzyme
MLRDTDAMVTIAVKDAGAAGKFYEETLGFERFGPDDPDMRMYRSGSAQILVYESQYAGTNEATAATWNVGNELEEIVRTLEGKGVKFEHYDDLPEATRNGSIHSAKGWAGAWFKDPDGNILALMRGGPS